MRLYALWVTGKDSRMEAGGTELPEGAQVVGVTSAGMGRANAYWAVVWYTLPEASIEL